MVLNNFFFLIFFMLSQLSFALITSSLKPQCDEQDQTALLHFKNNFSLDQTNCSNPNPHLLSWLPNNETNNTAGCCSWEGVTCEASSGRVIGLDLSYGCLHGPFNATNPIFQIPHLQQLNLSGNDFSQSQIQPAFGKFSMLNSLNLSQASFSGLVPQEILELSSLTSLDLSGNPFLQLPSHGLESIAHNMKDLTELNLSLIIINSAVPATFANLTSLRMLELEDCILQGYFPVEIFLLPSLESLHLNKNRDLYGHMPEFPLRSSLRTLTLSFTNFSGELPRSIGNLISLQRLSVYECKFSGSIPYTIGNLVNMTGLSLGYNQFNSYIPSSLGNLTKLTHLHLQGTYLYGSMPPSLAKLEQIEELFLSDNFLSGQIPSWIGNLTRLVELSLDDNHFEGHIPSSIFSLKNLEILILNSNELNGIVDISMFHEQKNIRVLTLSQNYLSVVSIKFANFSLPNLEALDLSNCNLKEFPHFLKQQEQLTHLYLGANNFSGEIPAWFLNVSTKTMVFLDISDNFLTRFEQPMVVLPWSKLQVLKLDYNNIHGSLPIPPPSISFYILSNNSLVGELSPAICKANTLKVLDLSNNMLHGVIPACLGSMGSSIQILNLKGNNFEGKMPQMQRDNCSLRWINLSQNQLKGKLPRSLAKCKDLESLDMGNNQISDTFPSWLGTLPQLQVLILKTNNFQGPVESPSSMAVFLELRIIDLSNNSLTGALPLGYFSLWKAMKITPEEELKYLQVDFTWDLTHLRLGNIINILDYPMSIKLMNKGMDREYNKVSNLMVFLSLSENKFVGEIPKSVGDLIGLNGLDLSNNNLTGTIPSTLGELKHLESLDLSRNMLSGEIPQQLSQLTFLAYLNLSYNNLSGMIPRGGQLDTFGNSSFEGNPGLYGLPLSNRRGNANEPSPTQEGQGHETSDHTILVLGFEGFVTGVAIGLGIGYIITTRNHQWFVNTYLILKNRIQ